MASDDERARLLALAEGTYLRRAVLALDERGMKSRIIRLNSFQMLSVSALAAVTGVSTYRVEQALEGHPRPVTRGALNPAHLGWLAYMLSKGRATDAWVQLMTRGGTSISTISDLTGISEATLYRHKGGK